LVIFSLFIIFYHSFYVLFNLKLISFFHYFFLNKYLYHIQYILCKNLIIYFMLILYMALSLILIQNCHRLSKSYFYYYFIQSIHLLFFMFHHIKLILIISKFKHFIHQIRIFGYLFYYTILLIFLLFCHLLIISHCFVYYIL